MTPHLRSEDVASAIRDGNINGSASIDNSDKTNTPDTKNESEWSGEESHEQNFVRWSPAIEIGDLIRDAWKGKEFLVDIESYGPGVIYVTVPSFNDRTHYLRVRLRIASTHIKHLADIKYECDMLARKGGQRVAIGGFGILVGWWGLVYELTFKTPLGWDIMEPITYLASLSMLMGGYLWFLYNNREVSYRSALNLTISRRQTKLYEQRSFDLQRWEALIDEGNALRKEIKKVAAEYDVLWDEKADEQDEQVTRALEKMRQDKNRTSSDESENN